MANGRTTDNRIQHLVGEGIRAWRLLKDPRTPTTLKLIPAIGLLYVIFPIDILPDMIPGAGQLDDIAILLIALRVFLQFADPRPESASGPTPTTRDATPDKLDANVVSATYRVRKDEPARR